MLLLPSDAGTLRQGDIISNVLFPTPRIDQEHRFAAKYKSGSGDRIQIVPLLGGTSARPKFLAEVECVITHCAVLSQCCDVSPKQAPPPPSFVLCRLVQLPSFPGHPELQKLLKENVSPFDSRGAFHSLFYLGEIDGKELIADFGQAMTIGWNDYRNTLKKRIFQLDDVERAKFRVKAGFHFGRPADEDRDAGLEDPWGITVSTKPKLRILARVRRALRIMSGRDN